MSSLKAPYFIPVKLVQVAMLKVQAEVLGNKFGKETFIEVIAECCDYGTFF